jgi:hypothetical protein
VKKAREVDGVLHVEHDLRLRTEGEVFEDNTMHGLGPCE